MPSPVSSAGAPDDGAPPSGHRLWHGLTRLVAETRRVDLTHAFFPEQPHFPAFPAEERVTLLDTAQGDGFTVHRYHLVGQWGTHVDPPSHAFPGGRTLDAIGVSEMILPLVVLDISARVAEDPDATPTLADLDAWQERHGPIPPRAFVALATGWSRRWPNPAAMVNLDGAGVGHSPGWSLEVLRALVEEHDVLAIGHEGMDTDPGIATSAGDYSVEAYLLAQDRWQIELLAHLDELPAAGAVLLVSWPKPLGGSGFPARAIAICPV